MQKMYIFGAHSRGQTLAVYLQYLYPDLEIAAYLYNNEEQNPKHIKETPVFCLDHDVRLHVDYPVYIGTRGVYHENITKQLKEQGFQEIYPVTVELDMQLRNAYLKKYYESIHCDYIKIDDIMSSASTRSAAVYVARSVYDAPLKEAYEKKPYERIIQAGAALADKDLPDIFARDDTGDNISARNRQFCELTVLYWIWKHAEEDIVGLAHYRRHFILPEDWIGRMAAGNVDVILPVPLYVAPSLKENFRKRHDSADWDCMMAYLEERDLQEHQEAELFFSKNLYSPCNMFVMRKNVLNELCEWLFPVLFAVAGQGGTKADCYQNRYPGFLSERLISFFFEKYREKYRVVYADKNFLL